MCEAVKPRLSLDPTRTSFQIIRFNSIRCVLGLVRGVCKSHEPSPCSLLAWCVLVSPRVIHQWCASHESVHLSPSNALPSFLDPYSFPSCRSFANTTSKLPWRSPLNFIAWGLDFSPARPPASTTGESPPQTSGAARCQDPNRSTFTLTGRLAGLLASWTPIPPTTASIA